MRQQESSGIDHRGAETARDVIRGLAAGLAGTAAMTLSQRAEMALTGRESSASPALAVCKLLGVETATKEQEQRLADQMHWLYGTAWGLGHPALEKVPEPARSIVYMSLVWSTGATLMGVTGVAPPPTEWKPQSLASDLAHHAIYTAVGAIVFNALGRMAAGRQGND